MPVLGVEGSFAVLDEVDAGDETVVDDVQHAPGLLYHLARWLVRVDAGLPRGVAMAQVRDTDARGDAAEREEDEERDDEESGPVGHRHRSPVAVRPGVGVGVGCSSIR